MGFRIDGNQGPGSSVGPTELDRVKQESGMPAKTAQRSKTVVKRQIVSTPKNPQINPSTRQSNRSAVAQTLQPRTTAVKTAPANPPKKIEVNVEYNNSGTASATRSEITTVNGRTTTKGITVVLDKVNPVSKVGGSLSWKEEFSAGATKRSSETVVGYDPAAGSSYAIQKWGSSAKVGNGEVSADAGLKLDSKTGPNLIGSIGYRQPVTPSTEVGVKVEVPGDGTMNAQAEVVQKIGRTELAAKYTQPLNAAGNVEFRVKQDIGGGSSLQISGNPNGEAKVLLGINLTP